MDRTHTVLAWAKRHPVWAALAGLFAVGLVLKYWFLVAIGGVVWVLVRRRKARTRAATELLQRAEFEHSLFMQGDARGLYGSYPPAA